MEKFNLAETLRLKAGITYEAAKDVLERTNWDLMEAMIILEREGAIKNGPATEKTHSKTSAPEAAQDRRKEERDEKKMEYIKKGETLLKRLVNWVTKMVKLGNVNQVVMRKHDKKILEIPVTAAVILLIVFNAFFWFAFIVSLLMGYTYRIVTEKDRKKDQEDIEEAARAAEQINQHHTVNSFGEAL